MAKARKEKETAKQVSSADKDILKEYGDVLHDPSSIVDRPLDIISIGPKLDIALGGGVPEGSLFIMTGPREGREDSNCSYLLCQCPEESRLEKFTTQI